MNTPRNMGLVRFIDESVQFGFECSVWHFAVILANVVIGQRCSIGACAEIGKGTVIGDDTRISHGVFLPSNSRVGSRVFIGPNVTCTDDRYPRVNNPHYEALPPIIEDDAAIGAGAILLPGVRIGKGALIGAGAVVTHDVPEGGLAVGLPAQLRQ